VQQAATSGQTYYRSIFRDRLSGGHRLPIALTRQLISVNSNHRIIPPSSTDPPASPIQPPLYSSLLAGYIRPRCKSPPPSPPLFTMFFKRLSRGSRSNSYAEDDHYDSPRSASDAKYDKYTLQDSPRQSTSQHNTFNAGPTGAVPPTPTKETQRPQSQEHTTMFPRSQLPSDPYGRPQANGVSNNRNSIQLDSSPINPKVESAPDLLTRAFNEAVRPFSDKIEQLESEVADLRSWVEQLELQRTEVHSWIDKRGLRPGKCFPPSLICLRSIHRLASIS
jgi:hypothetical protein